jgi:hypothetical protein
MDRTDHGGQKYPSTRASGSVDAQIAAVASRQQGNITRAQLRAIGLSDRAIGGRVRAGRLFRVHHGVYAVGRPPEHPLEHAMAAVLACGEDALLSHLSSLMLWGFAKRWPVLPEVTVPADRRRPGITVHRSVVHPADRRVHERIPVTSPPRTILDCARDLGDHLTRTVNDALHTPFLRESQLADVLARYPNHKNAHLVQPLVHVEHGRTRSIFEDAFLAFCRRYGLPIPEFDVMIGSYLADAVFRNERVIVECDGWRTHRPRSIFESDRDRDADNLDAGFVTVRLTWRRLEQQPAREAARLRRILARRRRELAA